MTKILLVEDDKSLREIYGVRLLAEGYDIVSAGDGEQALAMAIKERPQLIVSDVMMPKISGFDMLDILRSTTETKDIKVIMMTALSSEDQRARGEALGADRYLVKSQVGIEDVVRTIHEVLGDAPVASAAQTFSQQPAAPRPATPAVPPRQPDMAPQPPAPAQPAAPPAPAAPQQSEIPRAPVPPSNSHAPSVAASTMPQPTAPFSTNRPASLGERVIHPISPDPAGKPDISSLMDQELGREEVAAPPAPAAPAPPQAPTAVPPVAPPPPPPAPATPPSAPEPAAPPTPAQPFGAQPSMPTPPSAPAPAPATPSEPRDSGIEFEETPRPAGSGPQPAA